MESEHGIYETMGSTYFESILLNFTFFYLDHSLLQLPKLTVDHIQLKSFSKMNVSLAVQVMSKTMSLALKQYFAKGADETAKLCEMINEFFDCLNVRSFHEHGRKQTGLRMYFLSI